MQAGRDHGRRKELRLSLAMRHRQQNRLGFAVLKPPIDLEVHPLVRCRFRSGEEDKAAALPHVSDEDLANGIRCARPPPRDFEIAAVDAQLELQPIFSRDERIRVERFQKTLDVAHDRGIGIGGVTGECVIGELPRRRLPFFHACLLLSRMGGRSSWVSSLAGRPNQSSCGKSK